MGHPSGSPMAPYGQSAPGTPQQQTWQTTPYTPGYQGSSGPPAAPGIRTAQPGIPYAFGQLPANLNPNDPKSQHPIPGSYNRNSAFNPMTQSFVPGVPTCRKSLALNPLSRRPRRTMVAL